MKRRVLGRTGLEVSEIGFGGVEIGLEYGIQVGGQSNCPEQSQAIRIVQRAVELGINVIDTARAYGESEAIIGLALRGCREPVVIMSKLAAIDPTLTGSPLTQFMQQSLEDSLRALRTDVIDVYQIHSASAEVMKRGEILDNLARFQAAGKVRFLGATIYTEEEATAALDDDRVDVIQVPYNLLDPSMDDHVLPRAEKQEVAVVARSVLHRGVLTSKGANGTAAERKLYNTASGLKFLFDEQSSSMPHVATRFVLSNSRIGCALLGMDSLEQVEHNLQFSGADPYDAEVVRRVRDAAPDNPWVILPADASGQRQK